MQTANLAGNSIATGSVTFFFCDKACGKRDRLRCVQLKGSEKNRETNHCLFSEEKTFEEEAIACVLPSRTRRKPPPQRAVHLCSGEAGSVEGKPDRLVGNRRDMRWG